MKKIVFSFIIALSIACSTTQAYAEPKREILMGVSATFFSAATLILIVKGLQKENKQIKPLPQSNPLNMNQNTLLQKSWDFKLDDPTR